MTIDQSIPDLARGLRAGTTSAMALFEEVEARHAASESALQAYKSWRPELARAAARAADTLFAAGLDLGPLQGMPVSVKDLFGVAGTPTFAGCRRALGPAWEREGPVVSTVKRQAGVIVGKTHTVEFAFSGLGVNSHWGTPRNPWDAGVHRLPGGSSSGAGVSLCQGTAVVAVGTDTAGSVRIPASWTGVAGIKTSKGRWPTGGVVPLSEYFDTVGILTRTVADLAVAFDALERLLPLGEVASGGGITAPPLSTLRLGVPESLLWDDCAPGVAESVKGALDELASRGVRLVPLPLPEISEAYRIFLSGTTTAAELATFLREELPDRQDELDPLIAARIATAANLPAVEFLARRRQLLKLAVSLSECFSEVDALVAPTVAISPPTLEEVAVPERYRMSNLMALRNTSIANLLGLCAVTMPIGLDAINMPVGLQLTGRHGADPRLLAMALAFEAALGDARRRLGRPPALG